MRSALYSPLLDLQIASFALGLSAADHEHEQGAVAAISRASVITNIAKARAALDEIEAAFPAEQKEAA